MKIVFFGATELGYKCCRHIIEKNLSEITAILTLPEIFTISYSKTPVKNVTYADFHSFERQYQIPVIEVKDNMKSYQEKIKQFNPDFLLVIGWYYMIPKGIRELSPKGCTGFHSSLLPKYRGGAPLVWAIINGEKETGVTFFYMDEGIDSGDIIAQKKFPIEDNDTIKNAIDKSYNCIIEILDEYLPKIEAGNAQRIKQDESQATFVPQRKPEDGEIDWSWNAKRIRNFIRAQTKPYPGAFTIINGKKLTIWEAEITEL